MTAARPDPMDGLYPSGHGQALADAGPYKRADGKLFRPGFLAGD